MFCDLVASTTLAERLDPEDFRDVLAVYHQLCSTIITELEGYVAQLLGDGVMAYFSYPEAHEDDAERALRAGLRIIAALEEENPKLKREHGIELAVRIGVHTGPVVLGEIGGREHTESLALGHTVNIAARLQKEAKAGSVLTSTDTLRLVPGLFAIEDLGERSLIGIAEAVRVFRVLQVSGVHSRLETTLASGLTPLVGREGDLAQLLVRWDRARQTHGCAVMIRGEPGIGKSRLVHALRERLGEQQHSWLECCSSPFHQNSALHPFIELLRQGLRYGDADSVEEKIERLERGLAQAGLAAEVFPLFADLLSLPVPVDFSRSARSPEALRRETLEAFTTWFCAVAGLQPLVLVFEDLQWADPSSLALFAALIERAESLPVLLLATFRPSFQPPWPAHPWLVSQTIDALTPRQTAEMVTLVAGDRGLSRSVIRQITRRTDGVPLFVEELTKSVLELGEQPTAASGVQAASWGIPPTLQDSLEGRLDRLGDAKEVAQLSAMLGREFSYDLLAAVSTSSSDRLDTALAQLTSAGLLYRWGETPAATYIFKHALIRDTAYESLLRSTRRERHARIAAVLEEHFPDRVESQPEEIARHCSEGGLYERAVTYHQKASKLAAQRSANAEAIEHLKRGLELLRRLPESQGRNQRELELQIALGALLVATRGWASPEAAEVYGFARKLCEDLGSTPALFDAIRGLVTFYTARAEFDTVAELCDILLRLADRDPDSSHLLLAHHQRANLHYFRGELTAALEHYERAASLYDPNEHASLTLLYGANLGVASRCYMAWALWQRGYPERAVFTSREAIAIADTTSHRFSLAYALIWAAVVHVMRREHEPTRVLAEWALAIAEEDGFAFFREAARLELAWSGLVPGMEERVLEERIGAWRSTMAELASTGQLIGAPANLGFVADSYRAIGRRADALENVRAALAIAERTRQPYWNAELHRLQAVLLLEGESGGSDEPELLLEGALHLARRQQAKSIELRVATSLARLWMARGEWKSARELLAGVYEWFREGFDTPDLVEAKALLDELG